MKITIAIDSFKGSLSSVEAGRAASEGIKRVFPEAETRIFPVADGGEGTVDALTTGLGGRYERVLVTGPLGEETEAVYGITPDGTAIMEMSAAAGITLVPPEKRNPLYTTTFGVGEMINDAISKGCRNFVMGIGGSATNDGGVGMLMALGFDILDKDSNPISYGAKGLRDIVSISSENVCPTIFECTFNIACDVTNPLCGDSGCSAVYGPQKGADEEMIRDMDLWLNRYSDICLQTFGKADKEAAGAGAAGGLGFAFLSFLNAKLTNGIRLVLEEIGIEESISDSDIVITGEGRLDFQTAMGKAPAGVADIAKKYNVPVIAFSGCVTRDAGILNEHGIGAFFPIVRSACSLEEAMDKENAYTNMTDTSEQAARLIKIFTS